MKRVLKIIDFFYPLLITGHPVHMISGDFPHNTQRLEYFSRSKKFMRVFLILCRHSCI